MADVNILVDVATKKAIKELNGLEKEFSDLDKSAKKSGKDVDKSFTLISKGAAGAALAVAGIGKALQFAISEAIKIEDLQTQLIAFTGSAEGAADQIERLAEFAGETPFQLEELARANRTLLAFGSGTEESIEQLRQLGEASAATGADIGELARIFGQIDAAGKLTGERYLQLVERGINIGPTLAKSLGVAESSLEDLRQKGQISAEAVKEAFETLANTQYAGSLERQSKTLSGAMGILSDNTKRLAANFGKQLTPILVTSANATTELIRAFNTLFEDADDIDTVEGRVSILNKQLDRSSALAEVFSSRLEKMGDVGDNAAKKANYERVANQLAKVEQQAEKATTELQKLQQIQQLGASKDREEDESAKLAERLAKEQALLKESEAEKTRIRTEAIAKSETAINALIEESEANRKARGQARTQDEITVIDERFAKITEKLIEQQTNRLQLLGEFDEAEKLQVQAKLDAISQAEEQKDKEDRARAKKARDDEFNFEKIKLNARDKFDKQTYAQRVQTAQKGLSALSSLQRTGSKEAFEIGKAASIAQALVSIPTTAIEAYKSLAGIPYVGPALGAAAAAAAVAAGTAQVNQIRSQQFTGFQDGGLVEGGIPGRDSVPALLTPGEVVVPQRDFASLGVNRDNMEREVQRTNDLLTELIMTTKENARSGPSDEFLEQKFSSSTPGGIFYEPVDDSFTPEEEIEVNRIRSSGVRDFTTKGNRESALNRLQDRAS